MVAAESEILPKAAPPVALPASASTVIVRAIDAETSIVGSSNVFLQPAITGHDYLNLSTMCFLIEHRTDSGTEYVLFDCGTRKDFWDITPAVHRSIAAWLPGVEVRRSVDEILTDQGFNLSDLKAMIWSHWHFDHIGDGAKYPPKTDIVVGPGFIDAFVPGWPENPDGVLPTSSLKGHRIHELDFPMEVAGFPAHDYFGDGSFYLLDVPGHAVGHICGLARTTADTFIFMGGDCSHYPGMLRPTQYIPMPETIPSGHLDPYYPSACPCSLFTALHRMNGIGDNASTASSEARSNPFYDVTRLQPSVYKFGDVAQESLDKVKILDAQENVFVCLAHDGALIDTLPLYNNNVDADINDWKDCGYKEKTRWGFLNELPRDGKAGRPPLTPGLLRNGNKIVWKDEAWAESTS
ncbi:Beta-lactamase-like protein [Cordyceps javanica]|uniref:Beta-lactamase-like protein n=1 Tax=Cordyceps javanica TaxID=43265 RepID=A0A545VKG2_9HYPO|nr:Beta-lactamase-like protein [Cordyceps javanica]TQW02185.1 Beta-lactamase-like protein [Cordyceps javanica]